MKMGMGGEGWIPAPPLHGGGLFAGMTEGFE